MWSILRRSRQLPEVSALCKAIRTDRVAVDYEV